jgi:hypothetical protein
MTVIIIPGFFRKKEFYQPLANKLSELGYFVETVDLGLNTKNLKESSKVLIEHIKKSHDKLDIIAHSYGGIILKYALHNDPTLVNKLNSVTFVSVPHGGSWQSLLLSIVPAARELMPFRKHIKDLQKVMLPKSTVNFISHRELKIWPRKHGLLKGHIDVVIPNTNHDSIIHSKDFFNKAYAFMQSDLKGFLEN